jgi:AraC-like DNA-binding protein
MISRNEKANHIRIFCSVVGVDMVYESETGDLVAFFDATATSPLMQSSALRDTLRDGTLAQSVPYIYEGAEECYFAGLRASSGVLFIGPMCPRKLSIVDHRKVYRYYNIDSPDIRSFPSLSLPEIRNIILLANSLLENASLENEELLHLNRIITQDDTGLMADLSRFNIADDQNTDEYIYKHTYQEEELVVKAIMDGNAADAVRISERLDRDSGRLGDSDLQHRKLNAVVAITVCSRAAIRAGVSPIIAYKISGFYINKCDNANDTAHMLHYRNRAIEDLCTQVTEAHEKQRSGSYVRRCMDYVGKNYRYKIYLEDIAESMGISPSYLSRLFHSETGEKLQDYISRIRVMRSIELLLYSEMSLSEIAEYVGFPNQSYFGKMFRKYMSTTPRIYRDIYKVAEASSKE